jgi:Sec-independent protein translocase protein TatA
MLIRTKTISQCGLILILIVKLVLFAACSPNAAEDMDSGIRAQKSAPSSQTEKGARLNEEASVEAPRISGIYEAIDFEKNDKWGNAYPYFKNLGKPISRIFDEYVSLQLLGRYDGGVFFIDAGTSIQYTFEDTFDYTILTGSEICNGIVHDTSFFFPDLVLPSDSGRTLSCLEDYFNLKFFESEMFEGDYYSILLGNRLRISLQRYRNADGSVDSTVQTAECTIHWLDDVQFDYWENFLLDYSADYSQQQDIPEQTDAENETGTDGNMQEDGMRPAYCL